MKEKESLQVPSTQTDAKEDIQTDAQKDMQINIKNLHEYRSEVDKMSSSDSNDSESDSSSSSSTSSSDSSDSSSSSDSDSDDDSDDNKIINRKKGEKKSVIVKQVPVQNELDGLPPVEDLRISVPEVICDLLGEVISIVGELAVIKSRPDRPALREDTILFTHRGQKALGKIFDVFGQVKEPHYTIRFNSVQHLQEKGVTVGMPVYYCPNNQKLTFPVFLPEILKMKPCDSNCDASGGEHPDFSDDEEEKHYYEKLHKQKRYNTKTVQNGYKNSVDGAQSSKRICTSNTSHTLTNTTSTSRATLNTSTSNSTVSQSKNSRNRNYKFQGHNEYRHWPAWRNNNHFSYANPFNTYRPPQGNPRDAYFMYNMPPPYPGRYIAPPFNVSSSPSPPPPQQQQQQQQQYANYNLDNSNGGNQYHPDADMSTQYGYVPQHSVPTFGGYPTFSPPFYNSNQSTEFSHSNSQYTQPLWPLISLPPPPPPLPSSSALSSPNSSTNN